MSITAPITRAFSTDGSPEFLEAWKAGRRAALNGFSSSGYRIERGAERRSAWKRGFSEAWVALSDLAFQRIGAARLKLYYGVEFGCGRTLGPKKAFDYVSYSPAGRIVGDAKFFSSRSCLANITEYVSLLHQTDAAEIFMLFGNDADIPKLWLRRNDPGIASFYFLHENGDLEVLKRGRQRPRARLRRALSLLPYRDD